MAQRLDDALNEVQQDIAYGVLVYPFEVIAEMFRDAFTSTPSASPSRDERSSSDGDSRSGGGCRCPGRCCCH